jgi:hypothetical protein
LIGYELVAVTMVAATGRLVAPMVEPSLADLHQHDGAQARQQHRKRYFMTLLSLRHERHPSLRMAKVEWYKWHKMKAPQQNRLTLPAVAAMGVKPRSLAKTPFEH